MSYYSEIVYWKYNYLERRINKNEKKIQCNHPSVRFYCEIPYSKDRKEEGKMYEINEVNYERKIRAVCEYKTQINWLLKNEKNIEKIIPRYEMYY